MFHARKNKWKNFWVIYSQAIGVVVVPNTTDIRISVGKTRICVGVFIYGIKGK